MATLGDSTVVCGCNRELARYKDDLGRRMAGLCERCAFKGEYGLKVVVPDVDKKQLSAIGEAFQKEECRGKKTTRQN